MRGEVGEGEGGERGEEEGGEPRRLRHPRSPRARKLEKTGAQLRTTGGARKMTKNASKKPIIASIIPVSDAQQDAH